MLQCIYFLLFYSMGYSQCNHKMHNVVPFWTVRWRYSPPGWRIVCVLHRQADVVWDVSCGWCGVEWCAGGIVLGGGAWVVPWVHTPQTVWTEGTGGWVGGGSGRRIQWRWWHYTISTWNIQHTANIDCHVGTIMYITYSVCPHDNIFNSQSQQFLAA